MKNLIKPNTDERPEMIILGIIGFYLIIIGFITYLLFLKRLDLISTLSVSAIFSIIYLPRFMIISKLKNKDKIQILDNSIMINGIGVYFSDIKEYKIEKSKPQVIFFINNKMIVYQQAKFHLLLENEKITFTVIGTEKIKLLDEFLSLC